MICNNNQIPVFNPDIMKKTILSFAIIFCFFLLSAQEKQKQQLWFCQTEMVKPSKIDQYYQLSIQMAELCKKGNFPFSFYVWQTNDMNFELWTPIDSISDVSKILKAWENFDMPEEIDKKFSETLESYSFSTFLFNYKHSLPPKNNVLIPEEIEYCRWQEIQYQVGKYKELTLLMDEIKEMHKELGMMDNIVYSINGVMGFDNPNFILADLAVSRKVFEEKQENAMSKLSAEQKTKIQESNLKILQLTNRYKMKELYKLPKLSYVKQ